MTPLEPGAGKWKYDALCEVTDEDHDQGSACEPLFPHSHRPGPAIKWARRIDVDQDWTDALARVPDEPGTRPERWWCRIVGHRWATWIDNGGRRPCERCWKRVQEPPTWMPWR